MWPFNPITLNTDLLFVWAEGWGMPGNAHWKALQEHHTGSPRHQASANLQRPIAAQDPSSSSIYSTSLLLNLLGIHYAQVLDEYSQVTQSNRTGSLPSMTARTQGTHSVNCSGTWDYGARGVIKSYFEGEEIHPSCDAMGRRALKKLTSELVLEGWLLFRKNKSWSSFREEQTTWVQLRSKGSELMFIKDLMCMRPSATSTGKKS